MRTFLLTWNPDRWDFKSGEYDAIVASTEAGQIVDEPWSTGSRTGGIRGGDRAYLVRQHRDRGIVASGEFVSEVYKDWHWDGSKRKENFAKVQWDVCLALPSRLSVEDLKAEVPQVVWDRLQGSGVQVEADVARVLANIWERHLDALGRRSP